MLFIKGVLEYLLFFFLIKDYKMYQLLLELWVLYYDFCWTLTQWSFTTQHTKDLSGVYLDIFPFITLWIKKLKDFWRQFWDRFCFTNGGLPKVKQVLATYDVIIFLQKQITFLQQDFIFLREHVIVKFRNSINKHIQFIKRGFFLMWSISFPPFPEKYLNEVNKNLFFDKNKTTDTKNFFYTFFELNDYNPLYLENFLPQPDKNKTTDTKNFFYTFFELNDYNPLYLENFLPNIQTENIFEENTSGLDKLIQFTDPVFVYFKNYSYTGNPLYLLKYSPWPYLVSIFTLHFVLVFINFLDSVRFDYSYLFYSFFLFFTSILRWLFDLSIESLKGIHNSKMRSSFVIGFLLFILSEVMFFFSLFWAFFNFSLSTNIWLLYWPPQGLLTNIILNSNYIPELNTFLLIFSGFLLTVSHELFITDRSNRNISLFFLSLTILFGFLFLLVQYFEFKNAFFNFNDGVYASTVFFLTGFHGFHVLLGVIALFIALYRNLMHYTTTTEHQGFEFAIWYWHFVDVVWFFVYYFIYIWGNTYY